MAGDSLSGPERRRPRCFVGDSRGEVGCTGLAILPSVRRRVLSLLAVPALLTACPGASDDGAAEGSLVVGVQTAQDVGTLVGVVNVFTTVDGASGLQSIRASELPKEIELRGRPGSRAEVRVEAMATGASVTDPPIIIRRANAALVPDAKKLLRINLDSRCLTLPATRGPQAPVCNAPETCLSGRCTTSDVSFDQLEDYEPAWASAPPDMCRPANHGPPEVIIGTGQTDYATLAEGQVLQLEKGPQGGHHVWIATRMKNLRQSGSTTTITSAIEGDPTPVPPMAYVFTFDRDEGAYCKLYGLRYQVDSGAVDLGTTYKRFLGKRLRITVEVADSTGAKASSTRTVQIADKLLCPDGTDSCNTAP